MSAVPVSSRSHLKLLALLALVTADSAHAQTPAAASSDETALQVTRLAALAAQQGQQLQQAEMQIKVLQQQLALLQARLPAPAEQFRSDTEGAATLAQEVAVLREQQDIQTSEIATHEQAKSESASKYPLTLTGLILANAFQNSSGVDAIQSPTLATGGVGTTGITLRQTILGLDARGAHVFGGSTRADVRVDFFGAPANGASTTYSTTGGLLRLRTAHAAIDWTRAQAFFELDRPILSPNTPTSLTALAQPALAWSGNLWNWIPQVGGEYRRATGSRSVFSVEGAFLDVPDPPPFSNAAALPAAGSSTNNAASFAEQSRQPGGEAHLAYAQGDPDSGFRIGAGGYVSPHSAQGYFRYDAWAAALDYRFPLLKRFEASGAFYRGLALGGLGGGAYKDYVSTISPSGQYGFVRPLDDVGGWSQLKARAGQRWQFNIDFGLDNAFASEVRPYGSPANGIYSNLVRNAAFFSNVIYSPTAYTLLSFEYRRLDSTPASGSASKANVYGLAAGYRF